MRLPTLTKRQRLQEDARERHDRLWRDYFDGEATWFPATTTNVLGDMMKLEGSLHKFWTSRGYLMRCRLRGSDGFWLWLEQRPVEKTEAA